MADIPTRIAAVELRCSDVGASAAFYSRLTGLEVGALSAEEAALRTPGGSRPCLLLRRAERPGRAPLRASGLFHVAFRYPARPGLAAALRRVFEIGAKLTGVSDHGVSEALYLDDPDGLGIELYRDRPTSQWPAARPGERVQMFTAPLDLPDLASTDTGAPAEAASAGLDIGHVHLRVADVDAAEPFWTEQLGMELMTRFGAEAVFLGRDGYHHHIGANSWRSRGMEREPIEGPGLDAVALVGDSGGSEGLTTETPDGIRVEVLAA